ncbi:MAG TPA: hypothetical protein PKN52_02785, partial [Trueperaceae bacterium]|nr:hypothetical protein [Trueperaceae bacterium]
MVGSEFKSEGPYDTRSGAPLGALLEDRRLGLSLVVGDPTKRFLNVRWPEREPDRRWLEPGDLRLVGAGAGSSGSFEPLLRSRNLRRARRILREGTDAALQTDPA